MQVDSAWISIVKTSKRCKMPVVCWFEVILSANSIIVLTLYTWGTVDDSLITLHICNSLDTKMLHESVSERKQLLEMAIPKVRSFNILFMLMCGAFRIDLWCTNAPCVFLGNRIRIWSHNLEFNRRIFFSNSRIVKCSLGPVVYHLLMLSNHVVQSLLLAQRSAQVPVKWFHNFLWRQCAIAALFLSPSSWFLYQQSFYIEAAAQFQYMKPH